MAPAQHARREKPIRRASAESVAPVAKGNKSSSCLNTIGRTYFLYRATAPNTVKLPEAYGREVRAQHAASKLRNDSMFKDRPDKMSEADGQGHCHSTTTASEARARQRERERERERASEREKERVGESESDSDSERVPHQHQQSAHCWAKQYHFFVIMQPRMYLQALGV